MYIISKLLIFFFFYVNMCKAFYREYKYIYLCIKLYFGIYLPREIYCPVRVCKYCDCGCARVYGRIHLEYS